MCWGRGEVGRADKEREGKRTANLEREAQWDDGGIELGLHARASSTSAGFDCTRHPSHRITGPKGESLSTISSLQMNPSRRLEPVRPTLARLM